MGETYIVAIQARVLLLVPLAWMAIGLVQGSDPLVVTWRAVAAGLVAMLITGVLLRIALRSVVAGLIAAEDREREAEESRR